MGASQLFSLTGHFGGAAVFDQTFTEVSMLGGKKSLAQHETTGRTNSKVLWMGLRGII